MRIYRVQDREGRGPYRPGLSKRWVDQNECLPPPDWISEFGPAVLLKFRPHEYAGCGVRSLEQLGRWFSATEQPRLAALGFQLVAMHVDRILAESENQIVFARSLPLWKGASRLRFPTDT